MEFQHGSMCVLDRVHGQGVICGWRERLRQRRVARRFQALGCQFYTNIMRCPKCGSLEDRVLDSRLSQEGGTIRRRRECVRCGNRFTTYEEVFHGALRVQKRDGRFEEFERHKLVNGIERACEKRPVSADQIEDLADQIINEMENEYGRDIKSRDIGERVMQHLRKLDSVAYVRFASVYRQFRDAEQFIEEIKQLEQS